MRPLRRKRVLRKHIGELGGQYLFSDIQLPTEAALARTVIINIAVNVPVLLMFRQSLGGNKTPAISTMEQTTKGLRVFLRFLSSAANFQNLLRLVKKDLGNNRRMIAFPYLAAVTEMPVVERVSEYTFNVVV